MSEKNTRLNEFTDGDSDKPDRSQRLENKVDIIKGTKPDEVLDERSDGAEKYLVVDTLTGEDEKYAIDKSAPSAKPRDSIMIMDGSKSGRVYSGDSGILGSTMASLRPDGINPTFLYYFLESNFNRINSATKGSAVPHTDKDLVRSLEYGINSFSEQRKIATVLHTVDQAIEKTEEIISKREEIKRGLMQDIFRYGVDSNGQLRTTEDQSHRETKYGLAPEGWEILSLEEIVADDASITYGIVKPGNHYPGGVPVVKVENITDGEVQTDDLLHTDPKIHQKYDRAELKQGDLLFTIRGTVGRMAFVPESLGGGNLTQDTARLRVRDANPEFVQYYLETATPHNYFERHTKGQAVQGINLEDLQQVPVHLPSREEQERIVGILDSHTKQIQNERRYRDQLQRLKRGLMQDLLSGTVRTTDTNIEVPDEIAQYG
jgi:type I restriction enzyme S subunit